MEAIKKGIAALTALVIIIGGALSAATQNQKKTEKGAAATQSQKRDIVVPIAHTALGHPLSPFLALGRERGSLAATLPKGGESGGFSPNETSPNETPSFDLISYLGERRRNYYENEFDLINHLSMRRNRLSQKRTTQILEWARAKIGDPNYKGLCQKFVREAYEAAGIYQNEITYCARDAAELWIIGTDLNDAPIGAVVWFDTGKWGHAGIISDKNGERVISMIHGVSQVEEIEIDERWRSKLIGWGFQAGVRP